MYFFRHVGLVRSRLSREESVPLLICIVARTLKCMLRAYQRHSAASKQDQIISETCMRQTIVTFLNHITSHVHNLNTVNPFWNEAVPQQIVVRFGTCALFPEEAADLFTTVQPVLYPILTELVRMTGRDMLCHIMECHVMSCD